MQLFYQQNIATCSQLAEEDSRHLKVLRKKKGDEIYIIDGQGGLFRCTVEEIGNKTTPVRIVEYQPNWQQRDRIIHLAIAPTKNADRLEWFVEKAIEIGVSSISLIQTEHSERKFQKTDRLEKIAIGAMKQSLQAILPTIQPLVTFAKFVQESPISQKYIAHLNEAARPLQQLYQTQEPCLVLIGPEGDFSEKEIQLAQDANFKLVSLGNTRLRTETAGVVACTIMNL